VDSPLDAAEGDESRERLPLAPPRLLLFIGVSAGVRPSSLLLGQGCDEFAAEVRDVGDDAAPDQVALAERRLVHPGHAGVLGLFQKIRLSRLVCMMVSHPRPTRRRASFL